MSQEDSQDAPELAATLLGKDTAQSASRRKIPPSLAARYQDIQLAGEGAMGTVYRAVDPRLGRTIALKLLKGDDPSLARRFISEARSQALIQHEHVCQVYEAGQADGEPYIIMQFIHGEPLSHVSGQMPLEQQVKLLRQVALAVHEAHRLGMIHRDLKPGNILVEHREDGTWKPYVVDFGLARQVEDRGQTQTGEVLGTPAYMSPEQANGDVHTLDRRSDVYSLGATLYDVIAGRPPFVSDHPWKLLLMLVLEDAPPLSRVKPGVPKALETIIMKCLEREPARRYDTARALADDLQRSLDGDPLEARRLPWHLVLWRKARKHKLLSVVLGALVLGALGVGGVWAGAQRHAAEQARLAQELGESVKEMELFLRAAYGLPLHDVERERDVVRARLGQIEQRMEDAGPAGNGPGHYALGLGQLALGDPEQARAHLETALAAGYSSVELEYALGRAGGELFRRALEDTRRITNAEERQKKVAWLEKELREPALLHLRAAVGSRLEVPEYAEGLIALYEGRTEEAIAKAQAAFDKAPWMYEPKKLEADALYAEGSKYRHDAAFDYGKMKGYFDRAAAAYRTAAEMGRSDPEVHRAECELWEKLGWAAQGKGLPTEAPFAAAEAACDRAVHSSSMDGRAAVQRALVLLGRVQASGGDASQEALLAVEEALKTAELGVHARPQDVMAHYAQARALYMRTNLLFELGHESSMQPAIAAYQQILSMDPSFTWALNELGNAYLSQAKKDSAAGKDAAALFQSAIHQYERAMALDPGFSLPVGGRLDALTEWLEACAAQARDTAAPLQAFFEAVAQLEKTSPRSWPAVFWKTRGFRLRALSALALGGDPRPSVASAVETVRAAQAASPDDPWLLEELGRCYLIEAEYERKQGRPAAAVQQKARAAVSQALLGRPGKTSLLLLSARVELESLRAPSPRGRLWQERFEAAFTFLRPLFTQPVLSAETYQFAAELYAERASTHASPEQDVQLGLAMAAKALALNPHDREALLARQRLQALSRPSPSPVR